MASLFVGSVSRLISLRVDGRSCRYRPTPDVNTRGRGKAARDSGISASPTCGRGDDWCERDASSRCGGLPLVTVEVEQLRIRRHKSASAATFPSGHHTVLRNRRHFHNWWVGSAIANERGDGARCGHTLRLESAPRGHDASEGHPRETDLVTDRRPLPVRLRDSDLSDEGFEDALGRWHVLDNGNRGVSPVVRVAVARKLARSPAGAPSNSRDVPNT